MTTDTFNILFHLKYSAIRLTPKNKNSITVFTDRKICASFEKQLSIPTSSLVQYSA